MPGETFRCDLIVSVYDRSGTPKSRGDADEVQLVRQYMFKDAWPRSVSTDDLNSTSSEIILERVVMCYRGAPILLFPSVV